MDDGIALCSTPHPTLKPWYRRWWSRIICWLFPPTISQDSLEDIEIQMHIHPLEQAWINVRNATDEEGRKVMLLSGVGYTDAAAVSRAIARYCEKYEQDKTDQTLKRNIELLQDLYQEISKYGRDPRS